MDLVPTLAALYGTVSPNPCADLAADIAHRDATEPEQSADTRTLIRLLAESGGVA